MKGSSVALRHLEFGNGGKDVTCDVQPRRVPFVKSCRDLEKIYLLEIVSKINKKNALGTIAKTAPTSCCSWSWY